MNVFNSMNEMWENAIGSAHAGNHLKSRDGDCMEMVGWAGKLADARVNVVTSPARKFCPAYASAELLWYLSGSDDVSLMTPYAPSYARFANLHGRANGAYGRRWLAGGQPGLAASRDLGQLSLATKLLRKSETRQCVVTCWDASDLLLAVDGGCRDIPCTIALQFLNRGESLHLACFMRSNDAWLGLPYDAYCFTSIQRIMADALNLQVGTYMHAAGSMHFYDRDAEKLWKKESLNICREGAGDAATVYDRTQCGDILKAVQTWGSIGRWPWMQDLRIDPATWLAAEIDEQFGDRRTVLTDSLAMCAAKLMGVDPRPLVRSRALIECWTRKQQKQEVA